MTAGKCECIFISVNQFLLAPPVLSTLCGAFFCRRNRANSDAITVSHRAKKSFQFHLRDLERCSDDVPWAFVIVASPLPAALVHLRPPKAQGVSGLRLITISTLVLSWIDASRSANRFEALEPVRQGVHRCFGAIAPGVARGLKLRHDHGSNYMSGDFQDEIECLGIEASPSFVREPEGNGVAERFIRTLKENLLWVRTFDTIEELRAALVEFARRYNETWLVARHGYRTPAQVRADQRRLDQDAVDDLQLAA